MSGTSFLSAERSTTSSIGILLMVALTIVVGTVIGVFAIDLGESVDDSAPEIAVEVSFDDRKPLDPHWIFTITHASGDTVEGGTLEFRLVDDQGNKAAGTYPESFAAGQQIRMGLWGDPSRANKPSVDCTVEPEAPASSTEGQLANGATPPVETVDIVVVHRPTNSVVDRVEVDLSEYENPRDTELIDGSDPSFNCNDVEWSSGTVLPAG